MCVYFIFIFSNKNGPTFFNILKWGDVMIYIYTHIYIMCLSTQSMQPLPQRKRKCPQNDLNHFENVKLFRCTKALRFFLFFLNNITLIKNMYKNIYTQIKANIYIEREALTDLRGGKVGHIPPSSPKFNFFHAYLLCFINLNRTFF